MIFPNTPGIKYQAMNNQPTTSFKHENKIVILKRENIYINTKIDYKRVQLVTSNPFLIPMKKPNIRMNNERR